MVKNDKTMITNRFKIKTTECEKLIGIKTDGGLKFENYLDGFIKKASKNCK